MSNKKYQEISPMTLAQITKGLASDKPETVSQAIHSASIHLHDTLMCFNILINLLDSKKDYVLKSTIIGLAELYRRDNCLDIDRATKKIHRLKIDEKHFGLVSDLLDDIEMFKPS